MELINKNILYIDDDITTRLMDQLVSPLRDLGYQVKPIDDPELGVKEASHKYATILIDLKFEGPDMTIQGPDIFKQIRENYPLCTLILVTGKEEAAFEDMPLLNVDGCISKGHLETIKSKDLPNYLENKILKAFKLKLEKKDFKVLNEIEEGKHQDTIDSTVDVLNEIERLIQEKPDNKYVPINAVYMAEKASDEFIAKRKQKQKLDITQISSTPFKNPFLYKSQPFSKMLITMHILKNNPADKWKNAKSKYPQLKNFIKYFGL